jgi:catechol-2,3-dioxygenase
MYHFAILYPTRRDLAVALKRLLDGGWSIDGASDHITHEAIYLHDPDFNGIELAWDRPQNEWPRKDGQISFEGRKPLDFENLLAELDEPDSAGYLQDLTDRIRLAAASLACGVLNRRPRDQKFFEFL